MNNINQMNLRRAFRCFNPRNNTAPGQGSQQSRDMASTESHSMISMGISTPPADHRSDKHQAGDYLRRTNKAVFSIALFIGATSAGLVINDVQPQHFVFLLVPYNTLLDLSVFIGASLAIYYTISINSTDRNHTSSSIISDDELVVVLKMMMWLGLISIFLALVLRGLMVQNYTSVLLACLLYITIIGLTFFYLGLVLKKKTVPASDGLIV